MRGLGLFIALEFRKPGFGKVFAKEALKFGLATKDTHDTSVRLSPPLVITKDQVNEAVEAIRKTLNSLSHE